MLLEKAIKLAREAHVNQFRAGSKVPYFNHVYNVGRTLLIHGESEQVCAAGTLHDVVEDCEVLVETISAQFDPYVGFLVDCVTTPKWIDDIQPREDRVVHMVDRLNWMPGAAHNIKLADILDNMEDIATSGKSKEWVGRYIREKIAFINHIRGLNKAGLNQTILHLADVAARRAQVLNLGI